MDKKKYKLFLKHLFSGSLLLLSLLLVPGINALGQEKKTEEIKKPDNSIIVSIYGKDLFPIKKSFGPFSPKQRSTALKQLLIDILNQKTYDPDKLVVTSSDYTADIKYNTTILYSVSNEDAADFKKTREELAKEYLQTINRALNEVNRSRTVVVRRGTDIYEIFESNKNVIINIGITAGIFIGLMVFMWLMGKLFIKIYSKIENLKGTILKSISIRGNIILTDSTITTVVISIFRILRLLITFGMLYGFINFLFRMFPWAKSGTVIEIAKGVLLTVITIVIFYALFKLLKMVFGYLKNSALKWKGTLIKPITFKNVEIISDDRIIKGLQNIFLLLHVLAVIGLIYFFIPIIFSFFVFTHTWADTIFGYILRPINVMFRSFIGYLPKLFFITVVIFINRYIIKFTRAIFHEIQFGRIKFQGFQSEWAIPTFKIIRFVIIIFTVIVIFPYLPGADSDAFKGVSIFLGVLLSLGSTSIIANVVAGVILTYMDPFRIGSRVKIGETVGDVMEKTLLVTRVKTIKNVIVTLPNATVLNSHIINYSISAKKDGLILHTTITLGYDVPWRKVHEVLIDAALAVEGIMKEPKPFVLQTSLDDYYVSYELNAYTENPQKMAKLYSELHQNMQDKCNEAGIEILSPQYNAVRDGNQNTIPEKYQDKDYEAPGFRLFPLGSWFKKD